MENSKGVGRRADKVIDHIVYWIIRREQTGRHDGVVVIAEGIGEAVVGLLPDGSARDEQGRVDHGRLDLAKWVSAKVAETYAERLGRPKKIRGIKLGYESRSAPPHAFDVMLGSQLGIGAYRALVEEHLDGHMISVKGQLELRFVPFTDIIHAETMRTEAQLIQPQSDFFRLARFLEARAEPRRTFTPGRRRER
jgi:6-phosphofructokinase 1